MHHYYRHESKIPVSVLVYPSGQVHVVVHNASSRAWSGVGYGKSFASAESAIAHYKGANVREAIQIAVDQAKVIQ